MRSTVRIVDDFLSSGPRLEMHAKRARTLGWAVAALLDGGQLSVTGLGRGSRGEVAIKHAIKRADRFVGNPKLHRDHDAVFRWVAHRLLGTSGHAVLAIDWTPVDAAAGINALYAAVIHSGRALPVLFEVHPGHLKNCDTIEAAFLARLRLILPPSVAVTLVADAGFRGPFFRQAVLHGFEVVTRLAGYVQVEFQGEWRKVDALSAAAGDELDDLGTTTVNRHTSPYRARVVRAPRPTRSRRTRPHRRSRPPDGYKQLQKRHGSAWVLASSHHETAAACIHAFYGLRMHIEEYFRDKKNVRFGWSLRHARMRSPTTERRVLRAGNLLLVAMVTMALAHVIGSRAEADGWHRDFQANTVRNRRVLALRYLALAVLASARRRRLTRTYLARATKCLRREVHAVAALSPI